LASPLCAPLIVTDRVAWSAGLSPSDPCKNGWSDRDAVCVDDSGGPRETPVSYSGPLLGNTVLCLLFYVSDFTQLLLYIFFDDEVVVLKTSVLQNAEFRCL